jgi:hypothetical protein
MATTDGATEETTNEVQDWSEDQAAEEILRRFMPEKGADAEIQPSAEKKDSEAKPERASEEADEADDSAEEPESDADDADEGDDEAAEETKEKKYADDGAYIKVKVGDEEQEFSVKSLARLAGQEAALTKKSMEVAEGRKVIEAEYAKNTAATAALLERARQRFEPYSKLDFNLLASQLPPEDYTALRESAKAAWEDVQFMEQHLGGFMEAIQQQQQNDMRQRAITGLQTLQGPVDKGGIEGFNPKLYEEICTFARQQGAPDEVITNLIDPWAIRMIHGAMLYARGKDKAAVKVTKVNKSPKKIVKTTTSPEVTRGNTGQGAVKKAMSKLQASGSTDDAAEVLLARMQMRRRDDD